MHRTWLMVLLSPFAVLAAEPKVLLKDLKNPSAVCAAPDGRVFVAQRGGDGGTDSGVYEVKDGQAKLLAEVRVPSALVVFQQSLFIAQLDGTISRFDLRSKKLEPWVTQKDYPKPVSVVKSLSADERGTLYLADEGLKKGDAVVYSVGVKFGPKGLNRGEMKKVTEGSALPGVDFVQALYCEGMNHLLIAGQGGQGGTLVRVTIGTGAVESLDKFDRSIHTMFPDQTGHLFVSTVETIWGIPQPGQKPVRMLDLDGKQNRIEGLTYDPLTRQLLFVNPRQQTLSAIPAQIPGWEVDESPLPIETEFAFTDLKWTGWDSGEDTGRVNPLRPLVLTHANDGSGRTFVATQHGVIHILEKGTKQTKVFLDLQKKVLYKDNENEQGLLGLAFHPQYKNNGEFYVFYTDKAKKLENVLSRFKVSKDDPNVADLASEEELLRVSHKFWNHDGGTVAFGPDGYLYVVLGDGGSANDPDDNGQKNDTLLGKILRLDVSKRGEKTAYAIPADNPFVGKSGYRPEIYATGVRNPWRLSFDRKTGQGWFGDVGQNLYEEINLLAKGANYGWRRRESFHPFGKDGHGVRPEYIDPIWEYHHDVGKSITAGHVYRGKALPQLDGYFLYADYVSGKVWGLKYDEQKKRVVANRPIKSSSLPIMSFGEDEAGELYLLTYSATGKGLSRLKATK